MSLPPKAAKEIPSYTKFVRIVHLLNLMQDGSGWMCILRTQSHLSLEHAAEVGPRTWKQFVSPEHHTNGRRACTYYKGLGECHGRGSGPYKGFSSWTSKSQQGGWWEEDKGRAWNVGSSSKALPMHSLCRESNPETPVIMILIFITTLLFGIGSVFIPLPPKAFEWRWKVPSEYLDRAKPSFYNQSLGGQMWCQPAVIALPPYVSVVRMKASLTGGALPFLVEGQWKEVFERFCQLYCGWAQNTWGETPRADT